MNDSTLYKKKIPFPKIEKKEVQDFVKFLLTKTKDDLGKNPEVLEALKGKLK